MSATPGTHQHNAVSLGAGAFGVLPAELRNGIWSYLLPAASQSLSISVTMALQYPLGIIRGLPRFVSIMHVNNFLRREVCTFAYSNFSVSITVRPGYLLAIIPQKLQESIPSWVRYVQSVSVEVPLKLPYFEMPECGRYGAPFKMTLQFYVGVEGRYRISGACEYQGSLSQRAEARKWIEVRCRDLKRIMLGALGGGTFELRQQWNLR